MRLITFEYRGRTRIGAWIDSDRSIVDLAAAAAAEGASTQPFADMLTLIEAGHEAWGTARNLTARAATASLIPTSAVRLLAPLPLPPQIRDFLCFEEHLLRSAEAALTFLSSQAADPAARRRELEAGGSWKIPQVWYSKPYYYTANRFAVSHPEQEIGWPSYSKLLDYELEFAAVIGTAGRDIAADAARDHIFGYTIFNDWSARDEQGVVMEGRLGPGKGKDFDDSNTFGPCIVTADELTDPYTLAMVARVDGEVWSSGSTAAMHHRFEQVIAEVSRGQTLHPRRNPVLRHGRNRLGVREPPFSQGRRIGRTRGRGNWCAAEPRRASGGIANGS